MSETPLKQDQNSDEIDLKDLILPIWAARKQILIIATICGFLGGVVGFLTPATYTASSIFLPQTAQAGGGLSGSLGGLASLAGINLNTGAGAGGEIPPSMYATVLGSQPFRKRILDAKIVLDGDSISYRDYLTNQPATVMGTISEYTIGLPGKVIGAMSSKEESSAGLAIEGLQPLSDEEHGLQNAVAGKVSISNDKKEGIVSLTVVEGDPLVAAQVAQVTEQILQDWIIEYKIKNAKAQYDFIEKQFEAKQKEFYSIQEQLANYTDRNQNVLAASYLTRLDRLQAEFDLVNTVYSELAKQKEQAAIQLSKDTPTFSVLDPVMVPKAKNGPKKSVYILGAFLIGVIISSSWVLVYKQFLSHIKNIQMTNYKNTI
jgi:uncharacterized protein involved in exopolysaccharide biosynthesis